MYRTVSVVIMTNIDLVASYVVVRVKFCIRKYSAQIERHRGKVAGGRVLFPYHQDPFRGPTRKEAKETSLLSNHPLILLKNLNSLSINDKSNT